MSVVSVKQRVAGLSSCPKLHLVTETATGTYSVDADTLKVVSGAAGEAQPVKDASAAEVQALWALEDIAFELREIGFTLVPRQEDADVIARFSIDSVRWDLTDWVADQAYLELRETQTATIIAVYRARTGFMAPTVGDMVVKLCEAVRRDW